jgi:hypothetical protein
MAVARTGHGAARLRDDRVLVTGGFDGDRFLASAEVYDPTTGGWASTVPMTAPRFGHTTTPLNDGRVLVVGGYAQDYAATVPSPWHYPGVPPSSAHANGPSAELYDPLLRAWLPTRSMPAARAFHTATLLPNGRVLVVGGSDPPTGRQLTSTEVYDPSSGAWSAAESMSEARALHTATLLKDGTVLVAGGYRLEAGYLGSVERYDATAGGWVAAPSMPRPLSLVSAMLLPRGAVLILGSDHSGSRATTLAEIFQA